jgi:sirohydrochlorin cobaltochelatase
MGFFMALSSQEHLSKASLIESVVAQGSGLMGEILLDAHFSLRHYEDRLLNENELAHYDVPEAARAIARYDALGSFRPLKTAPTLRRGWLIQLKNIEQVILALDFFYPAALDLYGAFLQQKLLITPLRETLDRQTGMYRITQLLKEEQAQELIEKTCSSNKGCLRKVLWSISQVQEISTLPAEKKRVSNQIDEIPLLCREACNLLVAAARPLAKKNLPSTNA